MKYSAVHELVHQHDINMLAGSKEVQKKAMSLSSQDDHDLENNIQHSATTII